jgi:type IV secretion system protein VirB4
MFKFIRDITHNLRFETKRLISQGIYTSNDDGVSDLLPFSRFVDKQILINVDGSFTILMGLKPADLDAETAETKAQVRLTVHRSLKPLETGWCMHLNCIKRASTGYIREEDCHFTDATTYSIDYERRMQYKREGQHFEDEFVLALTYLPPSDRTSKIAAFFKTKEDEKTGFDYTIYLDKFKDTVYSVIDGLTSSQFQVFPMSDDEILSNLVYCVNGIHAKVQNPERNWTDLRYMIANQDILTGTNHKIGDKFVKVVSMGESFPLETYPNLLRGLASLPFEFTWSTRYIFLSTRDAIKEVSRLSDFHNQGRESATKVISKKYGTGESGKVNRAAERYANEAEEALANIEMYDYRYGKYTASIVVFDEDAKLLEEKVKLVKGIIDNCNMLGKVEGVHCFEAYLGSIPAMARPNVRKWLMNSFNLADLMPTSAIWSGYKQNPCEYYKDNNPVLFYAGTSGNTPFRGCLHVEDNGHALVIGSNGSLVMNFLAAQQCRYKNSKVIVFDNNHASLPLTYGIADSVHYDLGYESAITFKPLANIDTHEDFTFAVEWLCKLCEVNNFKIKPAHITAITSTLAMIRDTAQPHQRTMSYFSYHMNPTGEAMEEFATQFKPYIGSSGGMQGQIFDATTDKLELKDFTVFEMSQLNRMGDTTLIPTVLYLLHMVERSLEGSPVSIYIHDGWTIFKHPVFRGMIEEWLRKISNKNVQIIIGVEQPSDIIKSEIADILMQSCKTKIFTANLNAKATQKSSYEFMSLNETQINLISNAVVNRQVYFTNPLGSRLIDLDLAELNRIFIYPPALTDLKVLRKMKKEAQDMFGYEWIRHNRILPEIAEFWKSKHEEFLKAKQNVTN